MVCVFEMKHPSKEKVHKVAGKRSVRYEFEIIQHFTQISNLKGTGTRDLIWLKVVSLDRSW